MLKILEFQDGNKLHITDDLDTYNRLLHNNALVIPEYTDANRHLDWPHSEYIIENLDELLEIKSSKETLIEGIDFIPDYLKKVYLRLSNKPWTILQTERLILREMTVDDVEYFYEIYSDPSITEYMDPLFENPEDEKLYTINYIRNIYGFYGYGLWTVIEKSTDKIIGRAGISPVEGEEYPDLGFVIAKSHQRKGYATEICKAIISYAKNELEFSTIQARVNPDNLTSIYFLKKLNFEFASHIPHQGYLRALRKLS